MMIPSRPENASGDWGSESSVFEVEFDQTLIKFPFRPIEKTPGTFAHMSMHHDRLRIIYDFSILLLQAITEVYIFKIKICKQIMATNMPVMEKPSRMYHRKFEKAADTWMVSAGF